MMTKYRGNNYGRARSPRRSVKRVRRVSREGVSFGLVFVSTFVFLCMCVISYVAIK